jgi:hypothetical protein
MAALWTGFWLIVDWRYDSKAESVLYAIVFGMNAAGCYLLPMLGNVYSREKEYMDMALRMADVLLTRDKLKH